MSKCTQCQAEIPENAAKCPGCGADVAPAPVAAPSPIPQRVTPDTAAAAPAQPAAAPAAAPVPPPQAQAAPPPAGGQPYPPQQAYPPPQGYMPQQPKGPGVFSGFWGELKSAMGDVGKAGKQVAQNVGSHFAQQPAYMPPVPKAGQVYPQGVPGPAPLPMGSAAETVAERVVSSHIYPQGNADAGAAVLTGLRLVYYSFGNMPLMGPIPPEADVVGSFTFEMPLALIDKIEEMPYQDKTYLVLVTTDGRRFPMYFEDKEGWKKKLEDAAAAAKPAAE